VWHAGTAPSAFRVWAAKRLSFFTTLSLAHEGQAILVSERTSSSKEPPHDVHAYSKMGMSYFPRQITRIRLYSPSPSLTVSMSP